MLQNFYKNNKCFHLDTLLLITFLNNPVDFKTVVDENAVNLKGHKHNSNGLSKGPLMETLNNPVFFFV